jgi:hypothetical protein
MHYKKQFNICLKCLKHIFNLLKKIFSNIYRMTHPKNYEYVKRWRSNHYELHKKRNVEYTMKWYYWKKISKEFREKFDVELFL